MTAASDDAPGGKGQGKVLIVDDEQQLRRLFMRSLGKAGYDVSEAKDGAEALALVQAQRFDLVISDVQMPDIDGMQLLQALRAFDPGLPVALVSGSFDDLAPQRAKELGAFACLAKPVAFQDLHRVAALALAERASGTLPALEPTDSHERLRAAPDLRADAHAQAGVPEAAKK